MRDPRIDLGSPRRQSQAKASLGVETGVFLCWSIAQRRRSDLVDQIFGPRRRQVERVACHELVSDPVEAACFIAKYLSSRNILNSEGFAEPPHRCVLLVDDQRGAFRQQMAGAPVISGNGIGKVAEPIRHTSENHDALDPARMHRSKAAIVGTGHHPKGVKEHDVRRGFSQQSQDVEVAAKATSLTPRALTISGWQPAMANCAIPNRWRDCRSLSPGTSAAAVESPRTAISGRWRSMHSAENPCRIRSASPCTGVFAIPSATPEGRQQAG